MFKRSRDTGRDSQESRIYYASQSQLIWRKFVKHKLAVFSGLVILFMYLVVIFAEFVAPYNPNQRNTYYRYARPQIIRFVSEDGFQFRPFVYGLEREMDPVTLRRSFHEDPSQVVPLQFFVRGHEYKLLGLIPTDRHLFGVEDDQVVYLFGSDDLGRCVFSRIVLGARISMTIGLVGVFLSFVLGLFFGGLSGYYGGIVDKVIGRIMEILRSFPQIPLWMALSAALPDHWPIIRTYFAITLILSVIGWTDLARVARGKIYSLKNEDFVVAARLAGTSEPRIILEHLVPSFMSHIIAAITLAIPGMILAETSLSFLGIGLRPPAISWGVLLQAAQNIHTIVLAPWLMLPGVFVIIFVLAFNFLGDGLRNAADPY